MGDEGKEALTLDSVASLAFSITRFLRVLIPSISGVDPEFRHKYKNDFPQKWVFAGIWAMAVAGGIMELRRLGVRSLQKLVQGPNAQEAQDIWAGWVIAFRTRSHIRAYCSLHSRHPGPTASKESFAPLIESEISKMVLGREFCITNYSTCYGREGIQDLSTRHHN